MQKEFNAVDYLVNKYVDGDVATIPVKLNDKEDFFDKFDPTRTVISKELSDYIDKCSYIIPDKYKIRIEISCPNLDDDAKNLMINAVKNHYGMIVYDKKIDLKDNSTKSLGLFLVGAIFLLIIYLNINVLNINDPASLADTTRDIFKEILLVTGWFFIWSAVETIVFQRKKLISDKANNIQMLNSEVVFKS